MKKIIVTLAVLIFAGISLSGQEKRYETEISAVIGIGANKPSGVSLQGAFRGRLNEYVSLGLG